MFEKEAMNREGMEPMDERLQSASQQAMRSVVKALPDDTLSMAWRSGLNERLVAESAQRQRRQRISWFLRPALGFGLAGALAMVAFFHSSTQTSKVQPLARNSSGRLEAALVNTHSQVTLAMDVAGVGVTPAEASYGSSDVPQSIATGWSEEDLDSL
jgi:hypothetical protein